MVSKRSIRLNIHHSHLNTWLGYIWCRNEAIPTRLDHKQLVIIVSGFRKRLPPPRDDGRLPGVYENVEWPIVVLGALHRNQNLQTYLMDVLNLPCLAISQGHLEFASINKQFHILCVKGRLWNGIRRFRRLMEPDWQKVMFYVLGEVFRGSWSRALILVFKVVYIAWYVILVQCISDLCIMHLLHTYTGRTFSKLPTVFLNYTVHFFSSVAHVWVPGAKTTGPIAKKFGFS
jgi:hypothetical protein